MTAAIMEKIMTAVTTGKAIPAVTAAETDRKPALH